jgi:hypothetical protein
MTGDVEQVERQWETEAQQLLEARLDTALLARIKAEAEAKLAAVREEIESLNEALRTATSDLDLEIDPPEVPEADPPGGYGLPLLDSGWSWTEQTRALIARKRYANGADGTP